MYICGGRGTVTLQLEDVDCFEKLRHVAGIVIVQSDERDTIARVLHPRFWEVDHTAKKAGVRSENAAMHAEEARGGLDN